STSVTLSLVIDASSMIGSYTERLTVPTWGVETFLGPRVDSTDAMVDQVDELLLKYGRCRKGDVVIITAGSPPGVAGTTNMVRVHHIGEGGGSR
ncbi:pyruvate kinase alpha/beta domain-containing protein, partial [Streptomyces scabiei]|uniref:pyruvate kinase alpha/beta domain-containing protein n=1 Tax=Streptomyces scabiei TaxID=1930 RepID=UPI0038F5F33C